MRLSAGNTAWVLVSAALVMFMTPGLALFYGGMVRARSVLNVMMLSFVCLAVVGVLWTLYGYSLAFGRDAFGGLIGGLNQAGLHGLATTTVGAPGQHIPLFAFAAFQLMFAVITVALLAGTGAERTRFWPWLLFIVAWVTAVYLPLAHWIFDAPGLTGLHSAGGWLVGKLHVLDFAGGTAVEVNSGAAALALALVLGKRRGWPKEPSRPHSLPLVMLGSGILWFGWFGFNAGSALGANGLAATAFINTMLAGGTGLAGWLLVEQWRDGRPTTLGAASGAVAGLVGITPACAFVDPLGALAIGLAAGAVCALAVGLKYRLGYDDSLDVVAVHGVGGVVGLLLLGFLATRGVNPHGADGLLYGGGLGQLGRQALATAVTIGFSATLTFGIAWAIQKTIGLRVSAEAEWDGIDEAEHAETAYEFGALGGRHTAALASPAARPRDPGARDSEPREMASQTKPGTH
ncbi:MAG: ammonium transporter [Gemmatimonadota bacterium]